MPQRPVTNTVWHTQQNVWLLLAEVYLSQEQFDSANNCLLEAASIFPLSHHIMFMVNVLNINRFKLSWIGLHSCKLPNKHFILFLLFYICLHFYCNDSVSGANPENFNRGCSKKKEKLVIPSVVDYVIYYRNLSYRWLRRLGVPKQS